MSDVSFYFSELLCGLQDQAPDAARTAVILAGQKDMADTVIQELTQLGVDKDLILTNF